MLIEEYFQQLLDIIHYCPIKSSYDWEAQKRGEYEGFIRAAVRFTDNSVLYLREFVDVENTIERETYSYQYMDDANNIIFRYDNAEHHKKLNLPNYPHHKHEGREDNILFSNAPMLADVLKEIERLLG
ncbi:hypothetical protein Cri9333_0044 [Crinalium epipsammum PCC 9333]|uniref:Uncharacterized protein n=1 Tax=Crinalium epipsammum PCC 9333 TaxID=1173022 RepID=K9VUB0_9CYAN|nr:DUF6516 family protein [Crinalium epipsammum]AFZ11047.1 hypothetical protein Cri9333_0044 [Crinalium epipsammum PCC 9333]